MNRSTSQQGIALLIVLWVVILLTVIASSFAFSMRTETQLTRNYRHHAQAEALAQAGFYRAVWEVSQNPIQRQWKTDGSVYLWEFEQSQLLIAIYDVAGLIDLNYADKSLIKGLLLQFVEEEGQAQALADAIIDWRDNNQFKQLNGAEDPEYEQADYPYGAKDGFFDHISELQQVYGMTKSVFAKVQPFITVDSQKSGLDFAVASKAVMLSVPNVKTELVDAYLEQRQQAKGGQMIPPPFNIPSQYLGGNREKQFRIIVNAKLPQGDKFFLDAVVVKATGIAQDFNILRWQQGYALALPSDFEELTDSK